MPWFVWNPPARYRSTPKSPLMARAPKPPLPRSPPTSWVSARRYSGAARRYRHAAVRTGHLRESWHDPGRLGYVRRPAASRQKMALLAAHLLDCRPEDLVFQDGTLSNEKSGAQALPLPRSLPRHSGTRYYRRIWRWDWSSRCILSCVTTPLVSVPMWPSSKSTATPVY